MGTAAAAVGAVVVEVFEALEPCAKQDSIKKINHRLQGVITFSQ